MRLRPLAALILAALPSAARGQTIEITPVAGYRFGGGNVNTNAQGDFEPGASFELDDSASFGIHLGYRVGEGEIELLYARQDTRLQSADPFAGVPVFDLAVDIWQLGGNYYFLDDDARVRPYVGVGLGLTRMLPEPAGLDDETRFSASFGAGAKLWLEATSGCVWRPAASSPSSAATTTTSALQAPAASAPRSSCRRSTCGRA